jgi:hypothetical protein
LGPQLLARFIMMINIAKNCGPKLAPKGLPEKAKISLNVAFHEVKRIFILPTNKYRKIRHILNNCADDCGLMCVLVLHVLDRLPP